MTPRWRIAAPLAFALALSVLMMASAAVVPAGAAENTTVPGADVTITADGLDPLVITVTVGAEVTWHNASGQPVKLTSDPIPSGQSLFLPLISGGGVRSASKLTPASATWTSDPIAQSGEFSHTYDQAGAFDFYASHAPNVIGKVTVLAALPFCEMVHIPAGPLRMGCDWDNTSDPGGCLRKQLPLHTVTLSGYWIDKYEVTNARYQACVDAGACTPPSEVRSETRPSYYGNPAFANYPVIYADWFQANSFCAWEGKRLPTEAEWEKAARGPNDTREYPWGDAEPTCALVNAGSVYEDGSWKICVGDTSAVGSYPAGASPYGVMDMSGNVSEWVNDWYGSDYYCAGPDADTGGTPNWTHCRRESPPYADPWSNPPGPATGTYRVRRGGTWGTDPMELFAADRSWGNPANNDLYSGFRCARSQ